jgi:hypothetical protein
MEGQYIVSRVKIIFGVAFSILTGLLALGSTGFLVIIFASSSYLMLVNRSIFVCEFLICS